MADQMLSSQAGPVGTVYEAGAERPPIPPKEPEAKMHDIQRHYEGPGNVPTRSQSAYAPQVLKEQEHSTGAMPPVPPLPIGISHSPQASMGYAPSQESPPIGHQGHQSLPSSTVSPIDTYRDSYQTQPENRTNSPAAPHYTPIAAYYAPPGQYNPNQLYAVGAAPYPPVHSPPPMKSETTFYDGAPPLAPPAGAAGAATAADGGKKKRKFFGMSGTVFSLSCVILFLIIIGAVLGGVFGARSKPKPGPDPPIPVISTASAETTTSDNFFSSETTTTSSTTTSTTSTTTSNPDFPYPLPTGVWAASGGLTSASGKCINDPTANNYQEVWHCQNTQTYSVVVRDMSTTKLFYVIDIETPLRSVNVPGNPPSGEYELKGDQKYWQFSASYVSDAFNGTGCPVTLDLVFYLGRNKAQFGLTQTVYSPGVCALPHGGTSARGIVCTCTYW